MNPAEFVAEVRDKLHEHEFDTYVTISETGDRLVIQFRWMGTTSFEYRITRLDSGFRADLVDQRVAPLHVAFSDRFERYFEEALTKLGGITL